MAKWLGPFNQYQMCRVRIFDLITRIKEDLFLFLLFKKDGINAIWRPPAISHSR